MREFLHQKYRKESDRCWLMNVFFLRSSVSEREPFNGFREANPTLITVLVQWTGTKRSRWHCREEVPVWSCWVRARQFVARHAELPPVVIRIFFIFCTFSSRMKRTFFLSATPGDPRRDGFSPGTIMASFWVGHRKTQNGPGHNDGHTLHTKRQARPAMTN